MMKQFDLPLPRPVPLGGKRRAIATLEQAMVFLLRAAAKVKDHAALNGAVSAVMRAAETKAPDDLETAAARIEQLVARRARH